MQNLSMSHHELNRSTMKRFLLIACLPLLAVFSFTNRTNTLNHFNILAEQIKNEIEQYAIAESNGTSKVNNIEIWNTGDIKLHFSGNSTVQMFNLFELYKTQETSFGIQLNENETFIRFNISESGYTDIHFRTHAKAKEVYEAFLDLIFAGKDYYSPEINLDIAQTRDSINMLLSKYASFNPQIRVSLKGSVIITNNNMQFFTFNLLELASSQYTENFEVNGIEMIPCTKRNVGANNWIRFNTAKGNTAFLRFDCISDAELAKIHQLLVHLRTSVLRVMHS